jgi:hypothetical protein
MHLRKRQGTTKGSRGAPGSLTRYLLVLGVLGGAALAVASVAMLAVLPSHQQAEVPVPRQVQPVRMPLAASRTSSVDCQGRLVTFSATARLLKVNDGQCQIRVQVISSDACAHLFDKDRRLLKRLCATDLC